MAIFSEKNNIKLLTHYDIEDTPVITNSWLKEEIIIK